MLHIETIEPTTLELLKRIQAIPEFKDIRLVGGTSLALQIGHRKSVDLDFFGIVPYSTKEILDLLSPIGQPIVIQDSRNIHIFILKGIKIDFVNFEFPWLKETIEEDDIRLASIEDIAAMKITAAIGRGTKKDFIDIAHLLDIYPLSEILGFYENKYPNASTFMALKSLLYFEDAEADAMPVMLSTITWDQTKEKIRKAIETL